MQSLFGSELEPLPIVAFTSELGIDGEHLLAAAWTNPYEFYLLEGKLPRRRDPAAVIVVNSDDLRHRVCPEDSARDIVLHELAHVLQYGFLVPPPRPACLQTPETVARLLAASVDELHKPQEQAVNHEHHGPKFLHCAVHLCYRLEQSGGLVDARQICAPRAWHFRGWKHLRSLIHDELAQRPRLTELATRPIPQALQRLFGESVSAR